MKRRSFIKSAGCLAGIASMDSQTLARESTAAAHAVSSSGVPSIERLSKIVRPLAITMIDYSWLLKHHRYGAYECYDKFLSELVERGYNAVRMDCFPHLIAKDKQGRVEESFLHRKEDRQPLPWGHDYSIRSHPRKSLIEFLAKCREHGVHVGLSTWFIDHGTGRPDQFHGEDDFVGSWHETLQYIDQNGLMDVVCYVDLLNEYPLAHGFTWLDKQIDSRGNAKLFRENNPEANIPPEGAFEGSGWFNEVQVDFYQSFMHRCIERLKAKWPDLDFFASETGQDVPQDYSNFAAIDKHFWFVHHKELAKQTGFKRMMWQKPNDLAFGESYRKGLEHWDAHKARYGVWMEKRIAQMAELGRRHGVPVGNTEGWGAVFWEDHPNVDWRFIREAAEICVPLAIKHGYKFICTSNFTCPQFKGMWEDVAWHQRMTSVIRSA